MWEAYLRNILVRASRKKTRIVGKPCGAYKLCGATWGPHGLVHNQTGGVCLLCLVLQEESADPKPDILLGVARIMEASPHWVAALAQGWDDEPSIETIYVDDEGDVTFGKEYDAYLVGRRLRREFVREE